MELSDAVTSQVDDEGVLAFAEHVLTNAALLWTEVALDRKQLLQQALCPHGIGLKVSDLEPP